ncbi:MAG: hypothetical protein R3D71_04000 [Rickettsiales bacterium]
MTSRSYEPSSMLHPSLRLRATARQVQGTVIPQREQNKISNRKYRR